MLQIHPTISQQVNSCNNPTISVIELNPLVEMQAETIVPHPGRIIFKINRMRCPGLATFKTVFDWQSSSILDIN